jgi:hypothetical protein
MKMKRAMIIFLLALFVTPSAFGIYIQDWERPVLTAEMDVVKARFAFENVNRVWLTATINSSKKSKLPYTGLQLRFTHEDPSQQGQTREIMQVVNLEVNSVETDACGSRTIIANLPKPKQGERHMGLQARFSVVLTDHSTRLCEDYRPNLWEASVRQGFGWCGTMDATMSLVGNPEPVYTIQMEK